MFWWYILVGIGPNEPWYGNYVMILTSMGVLLLGTLYLVLGRPYDHGQAPAADAYRLHE
jgi:hypothetical protein